MARNKEAKEVLAKLNEFLGKGEKFEVGGRTYNVRPLTVGEAIEFLADELPVGAPVYLLMEPYKSKAEKWLKAAVTDAQGNPVTLKDITDWPLSALKECFERLVMLSG